MFRKATHLTTNQYALTSLCSSVPTNRIGGQIQLVEYLLYNRPVYVLFQWIRLGAIFFLGYLAFEFPQNLALQRFPVGKWLRFVAHPLHGAQHSEATRL